MYMETRDRNRESFKFPFSGKELVSRAEKKAAFYRKREEDNRKIISALMDDRKINVNDDRIKKAQSIITDSATQREICEVLVCGFKREPTREFSLTISDVVFFGLAGHDIATENSDNDDFGSHSV